MSPILLITNPAIEEAKKIYYELWKKRIGEENKDEYNKKYNYLTCLMCRRKGVYKKYKSNEMLHIKCISYSRQYNTKILLWRHYCPECAKTYKPHKKRVGGLDH